MEFNGAEQKWNNERRVVAVLLAVVLSFTMLFSAYYILKEQHHQCHGAECPICRNIERCEQFLNQISTGLIHLAISVIAVMIVAVIATKTDENISHPTLVSFKVRLDN